MIKHLSTSSVNKYAMCPRSWRYHYKQKIRTLASVNLVFGSAFHAVVEEYVVKGGVDLEKRWPVHWQAQIAKQEHGVNWDDKTPQAMEAVGQRMFRQKSIVDLLDGLKPMMLYGKPQIEVKIEFKIPDVPVPIIGFVDIITDDGVPGDFKTSARKWGEDKARNELQPLVYLAGLRKMGYKCPGNLFRHYIFVKGGKGSAQVIETEFSDEQIVWGLEQVRQTWYGIRSSTFPASMLGWWCSEKWCDHWDICRPK